MKKRYLLSILLLTILAGTIVFTACKKEKIEEEPIIEVNVPIQVKQYEVVSLRFNSGTISENEYTATLGDSSLILTKVNDTILVVLIPMIEPETYDLKITDLGTYKSQIVVNKTEISETPTIVLNNITTGMNNYASSLSDSLPEKLELKTYINSFNDYVNNANEDEKLRLAKFYKANNAIFDEVLYTNYDNNLKNTNCFWCTSSNIKFKISVLSFAAATVVTLAPSVTGVEKFLSATIAVIAWNKARVYGLDVTTKRLKVFAAIIDDISSEFNKSNSETKTTSLNFSNNVQREVSFNTNNRVILEVDRINNSSDNIIFFTTYDIFNCSINSLNNIITFVNNNLSFVDIETIDNFGTQNQLGSEIYNIEADIYNNVSFSIPDISISVNSSYSQQGFVKLKLTTALTIDTLSPIETELIVAYNDGFNNVKMEIPVLLHNSNYVNNEAEFETGTFIDGRDGKTYKWVKIGEQKWMAENLVYIDTINMQNIIDSLEWWSNTNNYDGWCYLNNDSVLYSSYGVLYQWEAAKLACPIGWHLPTNNEWSELIIYLADNGYSYNDSLYIQNSNLNGIAKSLATETGWIYSFTEGCPGNDDYPELMNITGFSAFPTGCRWSYPKDFTSSGSAATYWTATEASGTSSYDLTISGCNSNVSILNQGKLAGYAVRCVKD